MGDLDDAVAVYSDPLVDAARYVDCGVLVEFSSDGIGLYLEGIEEDEAADVLRRALDFLQGS